MNNYRKYGNAPNSIITVHGGPGAPGSIAPMVRELAGDLLIKLENFGFYPWNEKSAKDNFLKILGKELLKLFQ